VARAGAGEDSDRESSGHSRRWCLSLASGPRRRGRREEGLQIEVWSTSAGLPQSSVTALVQTRDRYLWVGTLNGLARFDGVRFTVYPTLNEPGLPGSRISALVEADDGALLVATQHGGLAAWREGAFESLVGEQEDGDNAVALVKEPGGGTLLVYGSGRLWRWAAGELTALVQGTEQSTMLGGVLQPGAICTDEQGRLWAVTADQRLARFAGERWERFTLTGELAGARSTALERDRQGQVWLGTDQGLARLSQGQFATVRVPGESGLPRVDRLVACRDGGLWVISGQHARKLGAGAAGWAGPPGDFPRLSAWAYRFWEDGFGRLCVGTMAEGLLRVDPSGVVTALDQHSGLPGNSVRCFLEDDEGTRTSLVRLLSRASGFRVVASYGDGESALADLARQAPEVVLMDIHLPQMDGTECVRRLKALLPEAQFIMLTVYEDNDRLFNSLLAGANGYLLKRTPPARLLEAIREVRAGGSPMTPQIARRVVQHFRLRPAEPTTVSALTPREREVLEQLTRGYRYKEISDHLSISMDTVRSHIRCIYEKLRVHSRTEAVVKYLQG